MVGLVEGHLVARVQSIRAFVGRHHQAVHYEGHPLQEA